MSQLRMQKRPGEKVSNQEGAPKRLNVYSRNLELQRPERPEEDEVEVEVEVCCTSTTILRLPTAFWA